MDQIKLSYKPTRTPFTLEETNPSPTMQVGRPDSASLLREKLRLLFYDYILRMVSIAWFRQIFQLEI